MLNRTLYSTFHWNKASFWYQLARIRQVLLLLVFLPSLAGMQTTRASAAPALAVPAVTRLDNLEACTPVRIMPLGDSITFDYHEPETRLTSQRPGYRLPLWKLLIAGGYPVDFVGSRVAGEALGKDLVPPFDPQNEGHPSWTDDQIAINIYDWLAATPADVVLLHIGTNALDTSPDDVEDILNEIDRWETDSGNPVTVLLARIINRGTYSADTTTFNTNVATMAQTRIDAGDEIILIDMENGAGLNYGVDSTFPYDDGDIYDYLHPNDAGYAKMANAWFNGDSHGSPGLADILPVCSSLAVSKTGAGTGTVTSSPTGIGCGSDCTEDYSLDTVVTLSAVAGPGSSFTGWSGANAAELVDNGDGSWNLAMDGNKAVTANFDMLPALEPVGHWKFDESSWAGDCSTADILDSSGNNRHGIACIDGDAPVPVPGIIGNAGQFDGVNQYANMGPGFNFTSSFTAALWVALDDYTWCGPAGMSQHFIGTHHLRTPTGNGRGWGIYWDCDGLAWELTNSTGSAIVSYGYVQPSPFPADGSWHHTALVYDSTVPSATLYWDGVPILSESGTANVPSFLFNNGEPLTVNGLPYAPGAGAPGKIDETRVYNRPLSPAEIEALAGAAPACYTLTLTSGANGGVPSADPLKSDDCTFDGEYLEGEAIALNAHPDPGYRVSAWSGTADDASTALTNSLSMPAGDHGVTVAYAALEEYTVTITSEHGAVTKNPDQAAYQLNDVVQLTAAPEAGWSFVDWSGDVTGTDNPIDVTITGDMTMTANFVPVVILGAPSNLIQSWDNAFNWTAVSGASYYVFEVYDSTLTRNQRKWVSAADAGCDTDTSCVGAYAVPTTLANGSYTWRVAYADANWVIYPWSAWSSFTLDAPCYTLNVNVSPTGAGSVATTPSGSCGMGSYTAGSVVQLIASPSTDFLNWSGAVSSTAGQILVTMDGDKDLTATFKGAKPGAFSKSSPSDGQTGVGSSLTLSWGASEGVSSYHYCVSTNPNSCYSWSSRATTSVTLYNLTPGTTYYWQVRALNSNGMTYADGAESTRWSFTTAAKPSAFGKSSPSDGQTGVGSSLTLSWGASEGVSSYHYCVSTNPNSCTSWSSRGTLQNVTLSKLSPGTTYYWQVRALNSNGMTYADGAESTRWSFTTAAKPSAFGKSSPSDGQTGVGSSLTLSWGASEGATGYHFCVSTKPNSCTSWSSRATTSVTLYNLTPGTAYYWQVRALNSNGMTYADGAESTRWSFTLTP